MTFKELWENGGVVYFDEVDLAQPECLESHKGDCSGEVLYHSIDPGRANAFPRCDKHWEDRLDARENSIEKYADSDVPPAWFDPTYAGERWSEEDYF